VITHVLDFFTPSWPEKTWQLNHTELVQATNLALLVHLIEGPISNKKRLNRFAPKACFVIKKKGGWNFTPKKIEIND